MAVAKLNKLYKFQFEKAQDAWVLLYPEGMITLNPSAGEIMQLVDGKLSDDEIVSALKTKFPEAGNDIEEDILSFLHGASEKGWIVYG
jgi:pyrroloquinoline quinone biosynthesis protein D